LGIPDVKCVSLGLKPYSLAMDLDQMQVEINLHFETVAQS